MEVQTNQEIKLTPLLSGKSPESLRRCPKCASFYVTEKACEACGYQLAYDGLGGPMSDRSYYALIENYMLDRPLVFRLFPKLDEKNFQRALRKPIRYPREIRLFSHLGARFAKISQYFLETQTNDMNERKLYLLEWRELCLELLVLYGEAWVSSKLDELIDEKTKATKVNLLMGFYSRALEEFRYLPREKRRLQPKALNYVGGLLLIGIASVSALALMKYYTIVGH